MSGRSRELFCATPRALRLRQRSPAEKGFVHVGGCGAEGKGFGGEFRRTTICIRGMKTGKKSRYVRFVSVKTCQRQDSLYTVPLFIINNSWGLYLEFE